MKATIPIALQSGMKMLRLERIVGECWKVWIHPNITLTRGTFLLLYDNGKIERVTVDEDSEQTFLVKDHDKLPNQD